MKKVIFVILSIITISCAEAQRNELFNKTWQVEKITNVLNGATTSVFNKDSVTNLMDFKSLKYVFYNNGSYTTSTDSTSGGGTWAIDINADSLTLDTVPYSLVELSALHLTARGFSLRIADQNGTQDTLYTVVTLYPASVLPVSLLNFSGKYATSQVQLNWTTTSEISNKEFQVQYSADQVHFETIGKVPAKGGSGRRDYVFNTTRFQQGSNFYRLQQVDLDGHAALSPIVNITIDIPGLNAISLSPNPASNQLHIFIRKPVNGRLQFTLTTLSGTKAFPTTIEGSRQNINLQLPSLARGVYIAKITGPNGDIISDSKLVIQ